MEGNLGFVQKTPINFVFCLFFIFIFIFIIVIYIFSYCILVRWVLDGI